MSLLRRIPFNFCFGLFAGWAVGALESALVTSTSELAFPAPLFDSARVATHYAVFGGFAAVLLAFLPRRLRPNRAGSVLFTTFAGMLFVTGTSWIHQQFYGGVPALSLGPLVANGLLAGAALAAGYGFGRLQLPVVTALLIALAGHGVVAVTSGDAQGSAADAEPAAEGAPNVLFILIDTLRADHLSCYGHDRPTSPVLDVIAREGVRFDHAYAQATWTRPSVASLMTSLYPASHLTNRLTGRVPGECQTLAETVQAKGYATACFSANRNVSQVFGFAQGFDTFWTHASDELNSILRFTTWNRVEEKLRGAGLLRVNESIANAEQLTDRTLEWVEQHDGSPYFLYLQYIDPHGPYQPPADFLAEIGVAPRDAEWVKRANPQHGHKPPYPFYTVEDIQPEDVGRLLELYDAEIQYTDREIGRLLDDLRQRGLLDNTYVIITSDHGEEFFEHMQFGHGQSAFEELARVPLIISGPGIEAGVVSGPVELIDLYPTIATWVGAGAPERIHGQDLGGLLAGGARGSEAEALINNIKANEITGWVFGREKLVRVDVGGEVAWLLYDLEADPLEQNNLAAVQPERVDELKKLLMDRRNASGLYRVEGESVEIPEDVRAEMEGLGYVDTEEDEDEG